MILVDTSLWIDHIRRSDDQLDALLADESVGIHPFVVGEIALGVIRNRADILDKLDRLPRMVVAFHADVMSLIERYLLAGSGIGYVDAHLLASARITPRGRLWTRDRRLAAAAASLDVAWP